MTAAPPRGLPFWRPASLIATWFGAGLLPRAPGTWGSLAALPFAWLILAHLGPAWLALAVLLVFLAGWWAASVYVRDSGEPDAAAIVVDEVAGQFLALLAAPPELVWIVVGFLAFRAFDIVKPWPVSWAERRFGGGLGVMLDDVFAGVYGLILLYSCVQVVG